MNQPKLPVEAIRSAGVNPVITSIFTADPSAHAWEDGRLYIYASHDMDPARGCDLMDRYHVFSTEDMVNWIDEGEILRSDDVAWGRPEGGFMWAPDCAYKNGTYYFYYPHPSGSNWNDSWKIGVATSKEPAKGFVDQGYIEGLGGFAMIDPCVFVDDDGRAYMYYGGGGVCAGGELADDMMSMKGELVPMNEIEDFHEAAWVFKRNGLYYLTYADNLEGNNRMHYAVSDKPLGPWTYKGIFLAPTGCSTTHGSVAEYKGKWYLFYHNQAISGEGNLRSVCIDEIAFEEDGSIRVVEQTTSGLRSAGDLSAPHPNPDRYYAVDGVTEGGAGLKQSRSGITYVGGLDQEGSSIRFDRVDGADGGRAAIYVHYATGERLAKLRLFVNSKDHSLLNLPSTGGEDAFEGIAALTVPLKPGQTNEIRLAGGSGAASIDYVIVVPFGRPENA
ncbi:family 43 glycosylhydrolase [Paenibacillus sp. LHD-117]|uniref:family 43 glycosylhydrolase n=1 Tax=Paenibacillus sp. LHD-117 TaxID=3071412 RepID=UPI0027DEBD7D|nr:family 43 glycosylhydrolase [Paenibacillus sp. LHD-117]MDQ6417812.1 family 43 glycosylhydrolase [Paenibacillus sp. LHD-117]